MKTYQLKFKSRVTEHVAFFDPKYRFIFQGGGPPASRKRSSIRSTSNTDSLSMAVIPLFVRGGLGRMGFSVSGRLWEEKPLNIEFKITLSAPSHAYAPLLLKPYIQSLAHLDCF